MYVSAGKMLSDARRGGYAVGAFNFENMEMALAIVSAAEELGAPCILQTTPSTLRYASPEMYRAIAFAAAESVKVPVACHLDHGDSPELAFRAVAAGYSSVMIDGSALPFEENIETVKRVTGYCIPRGIPVEAELGKVGGKEDDLVADNAYTDPDDAYRFAKETGITSLAVAIGTAHGIYRGIPVLDVDRLSAINEKLDPLGLPLVLHGASGLTAAQVTECVKRGICKVNFATELRQAYTAAVRDLLGKDGGVYDPKKYGKPAMAAVKAQVRARISICGSEGKGV